MPAPGEPRGSPVERYAAFGFGLALISSIGQTFFIGLFGGAIQADLGLDPGRWGLLYGLATLLSGGLMFWAGAQADLRPVRWVLASSLALLCAGAVCMAAATEIWMVLLAVFLLRFGGQGMAGHLAMVVAARPTSRRGRSLSIAAFGFILGEAVLPVSVVGLLGVVGWRSLWWLAAAAVALVALPALWGVAGGLTGSGASRPAGASRAAPVLDRGTLLREPAFLASLAVVLVAPFVVTALFLQQASIIELRGWSAGRFASGFVLFAACQAVANWTAGALVDRFGARSIFRVYLWPLGLACLALGAAPSGPALWLMFAGLGLTGGAQGVVGAALWVELFGQRQLGLVRGVFFGFMVLSTAVSPFLLGAALAAAVPLELLGGALGLYALVVPWLAARALDRPRRFAVE